MANPLVARAATAATRSVVGSFPANPPAAICGNTQQLNGPATPPAGAIVVPAGNNGSVNWAVPGATFYFATGTHTLGGLLGLGQIQAAANSSFIGAPGAVIDGQGTNQAAFTQGASGVNISYLTVQNFAAPQNQGVVNHDSGANWTIQHNTIINNAGAGVMIGPGDVVAFNCLKSNGQYGFSAYHNGGDSNITLDHNEIVGNDTANWDVVQPGCGCDGGGKIWNTINGSITNNWVHNNIGPGIWVDTDNAGMLIDGNYIADNNSEAIFYEISYNAQISNNNILRNGYVEGKALAAQGSTFPVGAIYLSNSGGDSRVDNGLYATFSVAGNNLVDNWGGVTLWEDANRFCGSDLLSPFCTMGGSGNLLNCAPVVINLAPHLSDCRWKTQNISVHDNQFHFSRAAVGCTTTGCGEPSILANSGTQPLWTPYGGNVIDNSITSLQNNHFANNTYVGDWQYVWANTNPMTFSQWQGGPSNQDAGSTLNGVSAPPALRGNLLDADTSSLEGSTGHWAPWFSTSIAQTTAQAEAGTHSLQVNITAAFGWGVQLNNSPGFTAAPGPQTLSFWGLAGVGSVGADMQVQWRNGSGAVLTTNDLAINNLASTWTQASAQVTAPAGTAFVTVTFTGPSGATGVAGNNLYLDQIFVGTPSTNPPPPPPPPVHNALDNDTATLEGSIGHWVSWFSSTVAQSTAQAHTGTHSLQVAVAAAFWGVQLNNYPYFAETPGAKTISFWAMTPAAGSQGTTMEVTWHDSTGAVLKTDSIAIASLTSTWQQATANVTAPSGTATVGVDLRSATGIAGSTIYLDDFFVSS